MRYPALTVLLALSMTAATPQTMGALPPLPDSVFSIKGWVLVHRDHPVDCGPPPPPGRQYSGCYTASKRYLAVDGELELPEAWWVLTHETVHLAARDAGVGYTGVAEEALADAVATRTVAEMQAR